MEKKPALVDCAREAENQAADSASTKPAISQARRAGRGGSGKFVITGKLPQAPRNESGEARALSLALGAKESRTPRLDDALHADGAITPRTGFALAAVDGEVMLDEFDRWLGGFEEIFLRAITLGLARQLGSDRVVSAPSKAPFPFDYQIRLHVDDMIFQDGDMLVVRVRWALISDSEKSEPRLFVMDEQILADGSSHAALARVQEAAPNAFSNTTESWARSSRWGLIF